MINASSYYRANAYCILHPSVAHWKLGFQLGTFPVHQPLQSLSLACMIVPQDESLHGVLQASKLSLPCHIHIVAHIYCFWCHRAQWNHLSRSSNWNPVTTSPMRQVGFPHFQSCPFTFIESKFSFLQTSASVFISSYSISSCPEPQLPIFAIFSS